ncbi:hypothetical protein F0726_01672 [Acidithiobacillus caldus]|nr:hypothetical protein F0726_01672 [Acidithiobacillus caldus]
MDWAKTFVNKRQQVFGAKTWQDAQGNQTPKKHQFLDNKMEAFIAQ